MIRRSTLFATLLALSFLGGAGLYQHTVAHAQDYAAVQADPALWKVERGDAVVWLFGTFHLLPPELSWRTADVNEAMAASDAVWFEADTESAEAQQQSTMLVLSLGMNPQGVTLSSLLDAETAALLASVAPSVGANPAMLEPFRPWMAGLTLAVVQTMSLGFDPAAGVEAVLYREAQTAGQRVGYLETAEDQLRMMAGLPEEVAIELLAQTLRDLQEMPDQVSELVIAWATGDLDALDEAINGAMRDSSPELYEALLIERNRNWIPHIRSMLDEGGTHFVAVGAGHMVGDGSVIALLEAEGFSVVRHR